MRGKIVKGIAGFYYVSTEAGTVECKARGNFRNRRITPFVGDDVEIEIQDEEKLTGNIVDVAERSNYLLRPSVANVSLAVLVFAATKPEPALNLLDRLLVHMAIRNVETIIVFNKCDLISEARRQELADCYAGSGRKVMFISAKNRLNTDGLTAELKGKTSVLAGPSGVGKSTLMNLLLPEAQMETGSISEKIDRGKHTTRHSELFRIDEDTFVMDTPGFSSLNVTGIEEIELKDYYPEFKPYFEACRFGDCVHIGEAGCAVKEALAAGRISAERYENYKQIYNEIRESRRY